MNPTRQICAKPYVETAKSNQQRAAALALAVDAILIQLRDLKAPFITPAQIAPLLGIDAPALRYHCRNCRALKNWIGRYEFMLDDPEHIAALRALVHKAVWSVKALPEELQPKVH